MKTNILFVAALSLIATAVQAQTTEPAAPEAAAAAQAPAVPEAAAMPMMHHDDGMTLENGKWMKDGRKASKAEIAAHEKMMQMPK